MMLDFYEHQARAKSLSRRLVLLWIISLACLIVLTTILIVGTLSVFYALNDPYYRFGITDIFTLGVSNLDPISALLSGAFILFGVGIMSLVTHLQLRDGGKAVAEKLGGRLIDQTAQDPKERRAYSIVQEMALAANTPMPAVYVLDDATINAFAAGRDVESAAIGLTRGSIEKLSRSELQGVVAHEFSHIVNGDMRLNLRIVIAISGLTFIYLLGRMLCFSNSRDSRHAGPIIILGLSLIAIGLIGNLFGLIIQAAISRQREYLADASAVQFTRNPYGIAKALRQIEYEGSKLSSPKAPQFSHMMFGQQARSLLFATHPPLKKRISRLNPDCGSKVNSK